VESDIGRLLPDQRIGHIVIADSADAFVVAPATAHWLASMASGLAGDAVTAACLATAAPVVVAPAMDGEMYGHPATRANVARLRDAFGYVVVEPEAGPLASGQSGQGRLAETATIVDAVVSAIGDRPVRDPGLTVALEPTEDILAGIGSAVAALPAGAPRPFLVGFAAETGSIERAAEKLRRKGIDLLVANDVAEEGSGFGTDTNHVWILN